MGVAPLVPSLATGPLRAGVKNVTKKGRAKTKLSPLSDYKVNVGVVCRSALGLPIW